MSGKEKSKARLSGIAYTVGVLVSFLGIAGLLIALKSAGHEIGWGFQLQSPYVVLVLTYLLFFVGLNLSGAFEFSNKLAGAGQNLTASSGLKGSFFTGVLATIVATPCTAPFMGIALGFALTQPPVVALSVFSALGFGLAFPYLFVSFIPALYGWLPKPGPWMVRFKEVLAFPIFATVIWLVWVYTQQTDVMGILYVLSGLLGVWLGVWFFSKVSMKILGSLVLVGVIGGTMFFTPIAVPVSVTEMGDVSKSSEMSARSFSQEAFDKELAGDLPVFVNMTADWCITCKVNEKVALSSATVKEAFKEHNVTYFKGDWTNRNEEIAKFLLIYGRSGVPLYIYYGARNPETGLRPDVVILPQILTPNSVKDVLSGKAE